ncbi:uncharacterized protein LOC122370158 [Amphibalanus amphitrite]|uniref:uncharacterized protein LOC122370158 n=1 Tax=Amphibalanus amphitrite TaxID=1232801 RepID=UPI001C90CAA7|nr:uncharacterized protein LOC122370158 [Amphibalanus amphitrite]
MGGPLPLMALFVVAVISRHVVSATDCRESNCQFAVRKECEHSGTVICSMKDGPMKQINITATSFPRGVRDIRISDAEMITFEPDAISSLTSLKDIEITNVSTLILLPRSLARDSEAEQITVTIRSVKSLQLHPETFHGWRGDSTITIDGVNDCQMSERSMADAQLRILSLTSIQSLIVQESAFSADSTIETIYMRQMKYISLQERALEAKVHWFLILATENITVHLGALSRNAMIQELSIERVTCLNIESDGIEAEIAELSLKNVAMETCGENTFGANIATLSLSSSHIHRTKKNCFSTGHGMRKLTIESSHLNQIDESGINGTVTEAHIKKSTIGKIAKAGLQLNVTTLSIENSTINEASEKAFVVLADSAITIRNCTIDVMEKGALNSLNVKQGYSTGTAHPRILLANLHLKRPQNGSLLFDHSQGITVNDVKTDIPCDCNITVTLGLDMSSEHAFWINQPLCVIKGVRPTLGHYLKEFCTEPTSLSFPILPRTGIVSTTTVTSTGEHRPSLTSGTSSEIPETILEAKGQPDDVHNQEHTVSSFHETVIATTTPVIVVALFSLLAVSLFFLTHSKYRLRGSRDEESNSQNRIASVDYHFRELTRALLESPEARRGDGEDSPRPIGAQIHDVVEPVDINSHHASDQGVPTSQASARPAGTHNTRVKHSEMRPQHIFLMPLPPPPPTEVLEMREHNQGDDDDVYEAVEAPYQEIAECQQQIEGRLCESLRR